MRRFFGNALVRGYLVGLGALAGALLIYYAGLLGWVSRPFYDWGLEAFALLQPHPAVVLVGVDEETAKRLDIRLKDWTRKDTARLIDRAADGGAVVVGLDYVLSRRARDPAEDAALAEVLNEANVVLACHLPEVAGDLEMPVKEFYDPENDLGAVNVGHINWPLDADGAARRMAYLVVSGGKRCYSLPMQLVGVYEATTAEDEGRALPDPYIDLSRSDGVRWGTHLLPYPDMLVRFSGPPGTYKTYPAVDVLEGKVPGDAFEDKIVLIGVTHYLGRDLFKTPVDKKLPGIELHASAIGTILNDSAIRRFGWGYRLCVLALGLAFVSLFMHPKVPAWTVPAGGAMGLAAAAAFWALGFGRGLFLDPVPLLLVTASTASAGGATRWYAARKKAHEIRGIFGRYVSRNVVDALLKSGPVELGGRRKILTVLFSDIVGFTPVSESMEPTEVARFLNAFFSRMISVVFESGGTLDKLMGDALMAFFGDPLPAPDHAARACRCALRMSEMLDQMCREGAVPGGLEIGVGLNTGEAVVGNLGSEDFVDYTVIGDEVNLASRLEGLSRVYGARIIAAGSVRDAVGEAFALRRLDRVAVKGKEEPVWVYELLFARMRGELDERTGGGQLQERRERMIRLYEGALDLYMAGKFAEAAKAFEAVSAEFPEDMPSRVMLARSGELAESPPPDWTGVTVMKTK